MFTGLIETVGTVSSLRGNELGISCNGIQEDLHEGDSVAVNGVCLTIIGYTRQSIHAQVMPVTLRTTNLGSLRTGMPVNLERAMRLGDRLGGHLVMGHVDGTASVTGVRHESDACLVTMRLPQQLLSFVIEKGSITVDGISLTIAYLQGDSCTVSLVGHTKAATTLSGKRAGDHVNIECDMIGKYIWKFMERGKESAHDSARTLDAAFLQEHGFGL